MANIKNIIGNKYGKLTVLELIDRNDKSKTRYLCKFILVDDLVEIVNHVKNKGGE